MKSRVAAGSTDLWRHERRLHASGWRSIAGIDEAGRGPLAGPVVAAAVILPHGFDCTGIDDSKRLTPRQREIAFERIVAEAVCWSSASIDSHEIDRMNILQATYAAMALALGRLSIIPDLVLVDGLRADGLPHDSQIPIRGGDAVCASIAAASIISKVTRDRLMIESDRQYPEYGFSRHKGYGSALHLRTLAAHGPCPLHRRTFSPVAQCAATAPAPA